VRLKQEYTTTVNGDLMFHQVTAKDGEVMRIDVYHTGLKKVATLGFSRDDDSGDVTCVIRNPHRKIISDLKGKTFNRSATADFEFIWESDINIIGDEIKQKLKLK